MDHTLEAITLLQENMGLNLYDPVLGHGFLRMTPETSNKEKVNWS